jgi:hypothetical protein
MRKHLKTLMSKPLCHVNIAIGLSFLIGCPFIRESARKYSQRNHAPFTMILRQKESFLGERTSNSISSFHRYLSTQRMEVLDAVIHSLAVRKV